jgi:plastocyanin
MLNRRLAVMVLVIIAVAALIAACGPGGGSTGGGGGNAQNVTITATEFKYDPGTITATAGQTINVTLKNTGSVVHTFVMDNPKVLITAQPGQSATGTFTAPSTAGSYKFYCDQPGHEAAGMTGTVTVK